MDLLPVGIVAVLASVLLASLKLFQFLLITGVPIGRYAWGGSYEVLPPKLRIASTFSIFLYALFALIILSKAGVYSTIMGGWIDVSMWVLVGYFFLGILMNAISRSKSERLVMTPVAAVLTLLFLYVALGAS